MAADLTDEVDAVKLDVGLRVSEIRVRRGLTQRELAEQLGVSDKYVQQIEAGTQNLTIKSLVNLAVVLDVRVKEFFYVPRKAERRLGRPKSRG